MLYKVTLNGKIYEVEVQKGEAILQSEYEAATSAAAPSAQIAAQSVAPAEKADATATIGSADAIKSPLPGNINAVKVSSGQKVKKDDVLIILEAMKMENEIVSPKDGTIGQIFVQKGATVNTGAPLLEII